MSNEEWFEKAAQSILDTDEKAATEIAQNALEAGVDPLEMISNGFAKGIRVMGDLFDRGEIFCPR